MSGTINIVPTRNRMADVWYMVSREKCSFNLPATLIVSTIEPVNSGVKIPITLPMNASSVDFITIVLIPI